jgi:hypothetical protein
MDLNDVERIDFNALGGADTITIGDLSGTDLTEVNINLKAGEGGGDGLPDSVIVDGSKGADNVEVTGAGSFYSVLGLHAVVNVGNSEGALDDLVVDLRTAIRFLCRHAIIRVDADGQRPWRRFNLRQPGRDILSGDSATTIDGNGGNDVATLGDGRDTLYGIPATAALSKGSPDQIA